MPRNLKAGDRVTTLLSSVPPTQVWYEIVDPVGFAGTLPTAVIVDGPNVGQSVVLTRPGRPKP